MKFPIQLIKNLKIKYFLKIRFLFDMSPEMPFKGNMKFSPFKALKYKKYPRQLTNKLYIPLLKCLLTNHFQTNTIFNN